MTNQIKIYSFAYMAFFLAHSLYAVDYYLKNELPFAVNVQVDCGLNHETMAIAGGVTAYFRVLKCNQNPSLSVSAAGTMPSRSLQKVQKITFSKPYLRIYLDKEKNLFFEVLDLPKDAVAQDNIQNYDLSL